MQTNNFNKNIFFVVFLLLSVNLFAQKTVIFGAREKYYMAENEANIVIDSNILKKYDPYNNNLNHQVPLQRYINSPDYDLFIGLAVSDSPDSLLQFYMSDTNYNVLSVDTVVIRRKNYYKIFSEYNNMFNFKLIYKTRKTHYTAVLNFVSVSKNIIAQLFKNDEFFYQKFRKKVKR